MKKKLKLKEQVLRVACALSLVFTLIPISSAFATGSDGGEPIEPTAPVEEQNSEQPEGEPGSEQSEQPEQGDEQPEQPEPSPEQPEQSEAQEDLNGEPAESQEPQAEPDGQQAPEAEEQNPAKAMEAEKAPAPRSSFRMGPQSVEPTYTLRVKPIEVTGVTSQTLPSVVGDIEIVNSTDPDGSAVATILGTDLATESAAWDWTFAQLVNGEFEAGITWNGTTAEILWSTINYTHYQGNISGVALGIDSTALQGLIVNALNSAGISGVNAGNVTTEVDIPTEYTVPVNFNPTIGSPVSQIEVDTDKTTYYVDATDHPTTPGTSFSVFITDENNPSSGIRAASWQLLDTNNSDTVVVEDAFQLTRPLPNASYPKLSELTAQPNENSKIPATGTLPVPSSANFLNGYTAYPTSGLSLKITVQTGAGNSVTDDTPITVSDNHAPTITLTATAGTLSPGAVDPGEEGPIYYDERTLTLTIEDEDSNLKDASEYSVPSLYGTWALMNQRPEDVGKKVSFNLTPDSDGTYFATDDQAVIEFIYSATDDAGTTTELTHLSSGFNVAKFVIDKTDPEATITPGAPESGVYTYGAAIPTVTFSGSDEGDSGLWKYQYFRVGSPEANQNETFEALANTYASNGKTADFPLGDDEAPQLPILDDRFVYMLKIWDKAGNVGYATSNGIITDKTAPQVTNGVAGLTFQEVDDEGAPTSDGVSADGIYNNNVKVTFQGSDQLVDAVTQSTDPYAATNRTASGLKKASYKLYYLDSDGNKIEGGEIQPETSIIPSPTASLDTNPTWEDIEHSITAPWNFAFTIPKGNDLYPQVGIEIFVEDRAGNSNETSPVKTAVKIDSTAPAVSVSYDNNDAYGDKSNVFIEGREATIEVTDLNFNPTDFNICVTRSYSTVGDGALNPWTNLSWDTLTLAPVPDKNNTQRVATLAFNADGDYLWNALSITDQAGNPASFDFDNTFPDVYDDPDTSGVVEPVAPWDFVIDTQRPVITVTYSGGEYNSDDGTYNVDAVAGPEFFVRRNVTVTVEDAGGFEPDGGFTITFSENGQLKSYDLTEESPYKFAWVSSASPQELADGHYNFSGITTTALDRALRPSDYDDMADKDGSADRVIIMDEAGSYNEEEGFFVDSTNPTPAIELIDQPIDHDPANDSDSYTYPDGRIANYSYDDNDDDKKVEVELSGTDVAPQNESISSDIWKYEYFRAVPEELTAKPGDSTYSAIASQFGGVTSVNPYEATSVEQENDDRYVYVLKVWDKAGNVDYLVSNGLITDNTEPLITAISYEERAPGDGDIVNGIFNGDVEVTFKAYDQLVEAETQVVNDVSNTTASGLAAATASYELYYLDANGDRVSEVNGGNAFASGSASSSRQLDVDPQWSEIQASTGIDNDLELDDNPWDFSFTIGESYETNGTTYFSDLYPGVELILSIKDRAGNISEYSQTITEAYSSSLTDSDNHTKIKIDRTNPTVLVSYNNSDVVNTVDDQAIFDAARTATVTVTDLNFDPNELDTFSIQVTRSHRVDTNDIAQNWAEPLVWANSVTATNKNDTKRSATLAFAADGDYSWEALSITDQAGNPVSFDFSATFPDVYDDPDTSDVVEPAAPWDFAIDQTDPELVVEYSGVYNPEQADNTFFKERQVTVTVTDAGGWDFAKADQGSFAVRFSQDGDTVKRNLSSQTSATSEPYKLEWTESLADALYNFGSFETTVQDRALRSPVIKFLNTDDGKSGNDSIKAFTVDAGLPAPAIELDEKSIAHDPAGDNDSYSYPDGRAETSVGVDLSGQDATSGVWKYEYFRATPEAVESIPEDTAFSNLGRQFGSVRGATFVKGEKTFTVHDAQSKDDRYVYVLKVWDRSGNISYLVSNGIITDNTAPLKPSFEFTGTDKTGNGIFSSDVAVKFTANDQEVRALTQATGATTASGLIGTASYKIEYVLPDGSTEMVADWAFTTTRSSTLSGDPKWSEIQAGLKADKEFTFPISGATDKYQKIRVTAQVEDRAGNTRESSDELFIDTTGPVIDVSYDNNAVENDRYFKAGRTATLAVTDLNFDASRVEIDSQRSASWGASHVGDKATAGTSGTITYADDGEYTLNIAATDKAGNPATINYGGSAPQDFVVDLTAPVLSVAYDNNNVRNERYYNVARTGTITVVEQNFSDAGATISATRDGATFSTGTGFASAGTNHTSSIPFSTDGDYTLSVSYTDLAGNPANTLPTDEFVVDLTAPTIEFGEAVQDRTAYADVVTPEVLFRDRNYDSAGKNIVIEGYKNREISVSVSYAPITEGEQGTVADLAHISSNDDIYVLTATQVDLAGNESTENLMYSVNRFGSTWYLEGSSQELVEEYYANTVQELQLHEVNVNEVIEHAVSLSHEGNLNTLPQNEGYQVLASGDEESWHEYVYVFAGSNFQEEGLYEIAVRTTDAVQNTSSNVSPRVADSACPVNFVIDKTAPTIVLTGVEEGGRYAEESRTALIDVQDNTVIASVDVYLNGSAAPVASYSGDEIKTSNGQVEYAIQAANDVQDLAVVARDVAGNASERTGVSDVFISSSNIMILGVSVPRGMVMGGSAVLGLIVIGAAIAFLYSRFMPLGKKRRTAKSEAK
jgi:hypothetical protein